MVNYPALRLHQADFTTSSKLLHEVSNGLVKPILGQIKSRSRQAITSSSLECNLEVFWEVLEPFLMLSAQQYGERIINQKIE